MKLDCHCTISVTVVVRETEPDVAVTVMVDVPAGVPPVPLCELPPAPPLHPVNTANVSSKAHANHAPTNLGRATRRDFLKIAMPQSNARSATRSRRRRGDHRSAGADRNSPDLSVVLMAIVVLALPVPAGIDRGLKVTVVPAGLPVAENVVGFAVAAPTVVRLMAKLAV